MPSIDVAMVRSVQPRRTLLDVVAAAVQPVIVTRDAASKITDVKTAFSSWDNCMNAVYCKWPVIAIIIVGGLFLLSLVWCIARCACCGMSFCCECCYCLKCCGNCCGCCDPPRNRRNKYLDEPYLPPNQGYRSEAPMSAGVMPAAKPPINAPPQFASFDVSKTANHGDEDALPVMPSWETANTTKVYVEEEEVEMDNLGKKKLAADQASSQVPGQAVGQAVGQATGYAAGARGAGSPSPMGSPNNMASPYGPPRMPSAAANMNGSHPAVSNGYLATGAIPNATDPYGRTSPEAYGTGRHSDVSELSADYNRDYNYGAPAMGVGRQPSQPYQNNTPQQTGYGASPPPDQQRGQGYGQNYQGSGYNDYRPGMSAGQQSYGMDHTASNIQELDSGDSSIPTGPIYGARAPGGPARYGSPGPGSGPARYGSPGPGAGPYEMGTGPSVGGPNGGYATSGSPMNARPPPQRQYTGSSTGYNAGNASRSTGGNSGGNGYGSSYSNGYGSNYGSGNGNSYGNGADNGYGNGGGNSGNSSGYGNRNGGAATGYGASTSPTTQNNGGFNFSSGNSRPMNSAASPPPLAQPQPDRSYAGYTGYRGM